MTDIKLIEECRGGNLNNFRKLVESTSPFIFSIAFRMLGDEDQAKDITQETMVTIWQKISRIKTSEVYRTWVYRIVVNKCYDQLRKRKRNPEFITDENTWKLVSDSISDNPASGLENDEIAAILNLLTDKLSLKQKTVFILSEIEQMTHNEISDITGMNKSAIKANLHHARKSIRGMVEKYL